MTTDRRVVTLLESHNWEEKHGVPARLPLLDELQGRLRSDFDGWAIVFIQHHLGSTIPMVSAFVEDGATVDRIWHVDVPYSTDRAVNLVLTTQLGRPSEALPLFENPLVDYSTAQMMRTAQVLRQVVASRPERLLVVDDGAYALRTLLMLREIGDSPASLLEGACLVEQTTRGHRFLEAYRPDLLRHGITAVSVARTRTKLEFEAPFVGGSVAAALMRQRHDAAWADVLILGYGAVGKACVGELRRRLPASTVTVVDPIAPLPHDSPDPKMPLLREMPQFGDFDLVLGCTGTNSFGVRDARLVRDGAVLASASSADVELCRAAFVEAAERYPDDEMEVIEPNAGRANGIHTPVKIRIGSKVLTFLNAGFPVNFDGGPEGLSLEMIQPTRCLLYAAATEASRSRAPGLWSLSRDLDEWLLGRALTTLDRSKKPTHS
jgi:S-adenosylhomocysteine hydrolase